MAGSGGVSVWGAMKLCQARAAIKSGGSAVTFDVICVSWEKGTASWFVRSTVSRGTGIWQSSILGSTSIDLRDCWSSRDWSVSSSLSSVAFADLAEWRRTRKGLLSVGVALVVMRASPSASLDVVEEDESESE